MMRMFRRERSGRVAHGAGVFDITRTA
jgi:hypothetical protein